MSKDQMFFAGGKPNKGGRPRRQEPMERIDVRIPVKDYDEIIALAHKRGESVSSVARSLLKVRP